MNNIVKIEHALAFAKEVGLNDEQVKELMAMVLGLVYFKISTPASTGGWPHIVPFSPGTPIWPNGIGPNDAQITVTNQEPKLFFGINTMGCACSPLGSPHSDNCKAA